MLKLKWRSQYLKLAFKLKLKHANVPKNMNNKIQGGKMTIGYATQKARLSFTWSAFAVAEKNFDQVCFAAFSPTFHNDIKNVLR